MIRNIEKIEVTETSHPFATAVGKKKFNQSGYQEEEYFVYGTANVYERVEEKKKIRFENVPYVNRILVRRPAERKKFSGNVLVEILNSSSGFDVDRIWSLLASSIMRDGDIYVGITSKPNVISALLDFDQERYQVLSWKNPAKYDIPEEKLGNLQGHSSKENEDGLFWDMLIDLGKILKKDTSDNPIREYWDENSKLFLTGWSQSGGYMIRYVRDFAVAEGKNIFDGYFSCGSVSLCTPNLNQEDLTDILSQDRTIMMIDRPFIDMHTESDNAKWGNAEARQNTNPLYRVYDINGASHDSTTTMEEYYTGDEDLKKIGRKMEFPGTELYPNSFPYEYAYCAGLHQLYKWVRDGKEAIRVEPILYDDNYNNIRGEDGNSVGGWRLPMITYPVSQFFDSSTPKSQELELSSSLYGCEKPYAVDALKEKYSSLEEYKMLIEKETERCIDEELILEEDKESYIARAVWQARKCGLY